MAVKKKESVSPEVVAALRRQAQEIRKKIKGKTDPKKFLTAQELANGVPFYFVLREFIWQLKQAREKAGLTLEDISRCSGIAVESLSRLETGAQTNPTWKTLASYAAAVNCQPRLKAEAAH
jgi:DNA-binding XRE family transcriptional regulator